MKLIILPLFIGFILGIVFIKFSIFKINYFKKSIINFIFTLLLRMCVVGILALILYMIFIR